MINKTYETFKSITFVVKFYCLTTNSLNYITLISKTSNYTSILHLYSFWKFLLKKQQISFLYLFIMLALNRLI